MPNATRKYNVKINDEGGGGEEYEIDMR